MKNQIIISNPDTKIVFKLIDDRWWVEFDTKTPLDRNKLRLWKRILPVIKTFFKTNGYNELLAGCSTQKRVKWARMFGFNKIKEVSVNDHTWSVISMCF